EHNLPPEKVYVVGSSGLFGPIATMRDKERVEYTAANKADLTEAVEKATGKRIDFVDVEQEVNLQVKGIIPERYLDASLYVDVGGGGTRGGYRESAGIVRKLEIPGVRGFRDAVKKEAAGRGFAEAAEALAPRELREPLRSQVDRNPGLRAADRVYLAG